MPTQNQKNSSLARNSTNWHARALIVLTIAGIAVSGYLTYKAGNPAGVVCSIGGGCEKVLSSPYAKIFNIPVSAYGIIWYLGMLLLSWTVYLKRIWSPTVAKIWVTGGLLFSLYLLYLEMFVIKDYCTWCLVSLGIVVLSTVLVLTKRR